LTEPNCRISRMSTGYQSDIKVFCTPDIKSFSPWFLMSRKWSLNTVTQKPFFAVRFFFLATRKTFLLQEKKNLVPTQNPCGKEQSRGDNSWYPVYNRPWYPADILDILISGIQISSKMLPLGKKSFVTISREHILLTRKHYLGVKHIKISSRCANPYCVCVLILAGYQSL